MAITTNPLDFCRYGYNLRYMSASDLMANWRKDEGITQTEAAKRAEISQTAWCDLEAGKKLPRIDTAIRIARVTRGAVPVEAWVKPPKRSRRKAA